MSANISFISHWINNIGMSIKIIKKNITSFYFLSSVHVWTDLVWRLRSRRRSGQDTSGPGCSWSPAGWRCLEWSGDLAPDPDHCHWSCCSSDCSSTLISQPGSCWSLTTRHCCHSSPGHWSLVTLCCGILAPDQQCRLEDGQSSQG